MDDEQQEDSRDDVRGEPVPVSIEEALELAVNLHREGRLSEAGAIYRGVLREVPEHPVALHFLGLLTHQRGDTEAGITLIQRAVTVAPAYAEALSNLGNIHLQAGSPDEAANAYRRAIDLAPDDPTAHNNLGVALKAAGRLEEALRSYQRAAEMVPDQADYHLNLANALVELKQLEAAETSYRRAVELDPEHARAHYRLGSTLSALGRQEEALDAYRTAATLDAGHAETHCRMGHALMRGRIPRDAADAYRRALALRPDFDEAWIGLTKALYVAKDFENLAKALARWVEVAPANPVPRHMLAGLTSEKTPERASDEYVRQVFDGFASSFDAQLERLDYRVPALISEVLADRSSPEAGLVVLDAGCGTGLCGPILRPYASRLVGVDLSPGMLERASERAVYDQLVESELTAFLEERAAAFDLIVAADTLVYFGALEKLLEAVAGALRTGGIFVFTVERLDVSEFPGRDYRLEPHGRYRHSRGYVERAAEEAGLSVSMLREETLRQEGGEAVEGFLIVVG